MHPTKKAFPAVLAAAFSLIIALGAAEPRFLATEPEAFIALIPPPPTDDSPAGLADIETLLQVQKDRTPGQAARAGRIHEHTAMSIGAEVFGPEFTAENLPRTSAILERADDERDAVIEAVKDHWKRPRPYIRNPAVKPCVKLPLDTSYPSWHSTSGAVWTALLSEAMPEYKAAFHEEMRETMWCRVLAGVHYPTDTQAGRMLGGIIAVEMLKNQSTQDAVKVMRAEILEFIKTHPAAADRGKKAAKKNRSEATKENRAARQFKKQV
jgi:acid phosphatase (class A)